MALYIAIMSKKTSQYTKALYNGNKLWDLSYSVSYTVVHKNVSVHFGQ